MNLVFGSLYHLRMRLQPDEKQKNRRQKVFRFYCWQHILPISRVIGVINEFGFRWFASFGCACSQIKIRKIGDKKFSVFTAGSIFLPISRVMGVINEFGFLVVCIIYGCAYRQLKIRKNGYKKFSVFIAGSIFWPISRVMGVINEFGFR